MSSGRGQDGKPSDYTRCPENIYLLSKKKKTIPVPISVSVFISFCPSRALVNGLLVRRLLNKHRFSG